MTTIKLPVRTLAALVDVAPKTDVRFYLNGICLRPSAGHALATDGHILLMLQIDVTPEAPEFIISRAQCVDVLKAHKALNKRTAPDHVLVTYEPQNGAPAYVRIAVGENTYSAPAVDGRFPQCSQLMQDVAPIVSNDDGQCFHVPQYDPALLVKLSDAMMLADNSAKARPYLQPNRERAGYLYWPENRGNERALGLIMPMRADASPGYLADLQLWARK